MLFELASRARGEGRPCHSSADDAPAVCRISSNSSSSSSTVSDGPSCLCLCDARRFRIELSGAVYSEGRRTENRCESLNGQLVDEISRSQGEGSRRVEEGRGNSMRTQVVSTNCVCPRPNSAPCPISPSLALSPCSSACREMLL
jgi:hypothetical protein